MLGATGASRGSPSTSMTPGQSHEPLPPGSPAKVIKRLEKKLREIDNLLELGRRLNAEEQVKAAQRPFIVDQLALLTRRQPQTTNPSPVGTPSARTGTPLSEAPTMQRSAAKAAAECVAAHEALASIPGQPASRTSTRATADAVRQQMADERAAIEQARAVAQAAARKAETELLQLLNAPLDSWDDETGWQLAMCEYALDHLADVGSTPKQLQLKFRDACEMVRNPLEVPRLRGSLLMEPPIQSLSI